MSIRGSKILLLEDHDLTRYLFCDILNDLGCNFVCVEDGRDVIKVFQEAQSSPEPFDLLILDLVNPNRMGGEEAYQIIREIDSEINVVITSGETEHPMMLNPEKFKIQAVLPKPFKVTRLREILSKILPSD